MFNNVTREQIFRVASDIINTGKIPNLDLVRLQLGTGSKTTIHKYFKQWRYECLKKGSIVLNKIQQIDKDLSNYEELVEEKWNLKKILNKQVEKNEHYAQELISAEKANIALKEENHQLQIANQELRLKLMTAEATNNALLQTTQEINNRLDINDNKIIQKMQQTIDDLRVELKTLNETSLTALRETSNKGHETVMQEKVTIVNLQAKVDNLNKELLESKKQLNEALIVNQVQTRALSRQIEWQQKMIQEYIAGDHLQHQKEELDLHTANTTMVGNYGK